MTASERRDDSQVFSSSTPVVRKCGPRVHLTWRNLLSVTAVGIGYLAQHTQGSRNGREFSHGWFIVVVLAVVLAFAWMHLNRVRSLPRLLPAGAELLGFTLGGFEMAAITGGGSHRLVNTGVVGRRAARWSTPGPG